MIKKKSFINKIIILAIMIALICNCSGFLFFSKSFADKSKGKYKYYIEECASIRNKEIKKAKAIDGTYKLKYENVISEKEVKKDEMIKKKKDDYITEYVVCLYDEYDVKNKNNIEKIKEGTYYICEVTKEEFRRVLSDQLEDTNKKHQGISEIIGAVGAGAVTGTGTGAGIGAGAGTVTVPGIGTVAGGVVGGVIGGVAGAVGGGVVKAYDLYIKGEIDLDDYIKEWTDEEYEKILVDNLQYYNYKTKKIKYNELSKYISKENIKIVDELEKKYNKK